MYIFLPKALSAVRSFVVLSLIVVASFSLMFYIKHKLGYHKIRNLLSTTKNRVSSLILAAILGVITPFCSCASVPLFISFVYCGIPLDVCFVFLIVSPLVNLVALFLILKLFGFFIAFVYVLSAVLLGLLVGIILGNLKFVKNGIISFDIDLGTQTNSKINFKDFINYIKIAYLKIFPYLLISVLLAQVFSGFNLSDSYFYLNNPIFATILGVFVYINVHGVLPFIKFLVDSGVKLGTALSFLMSASALSLPQMLLLKEVLSWKVLLTFVLMLTVCIIALGYIVNFAV